MPGMWLGLPRARALLVAWARALHTNFPAKYQRTSAGRCRWRLKCTSAPGGVCGHRVCISCRLSGRLPGAARGASGTCACGTAVTPTSR